MEFKDNTKLAQQSEFDEKDLSPEETGELLDIQEEDIEESLAPKASLRIVKNENLNKSEKENDRLIEIGKKIKRAA